MEIIAFEGLDKSGKHTMSVEFAEELRRLGNNVVQSEFHRYDTPTGQLINDWLHNEYPVSDRTIEMIMMADKEAQQDWFNSLETQGVDYLILDRYILSEYAYASYKDLYSEGPKLIELIDEGQKAWRKPDKTYYIDIPANVSMERKGQHGDNDRYESDKNLLNHVRGYYQDAINSPLVGKHMIWVEGNRDIEEIKSWMRYAAQQEVQGLIPAELADAF